jgi:tetratricopeptide (TPR) repeat protein
MSGDTAAATAIARSAIDAGRDRKDAEPRAWQLVQTAMIFWHQGDYEGADLGFKTALDAVSEYPPALVGRGRVSLAKKDYKRAAELFTRAYTQSPLAETAWLLGDAKELAGDADGASEAYAKAEKEGRRGDPRTYSLYLSTKGKSAPEALRFAEEETKVRKDVYTEDVLAWALYRNGRINEAKAAIDHATRLGTPDARLVFHKGAIHLAAGDHAQGKKDVARALAMNPEFDPDGAAEARRLIAGGAKDAP